MRLKHSRVWILRPPSCLVAHVESKNLCVAPPSCLMLYSMQIQRPVLQAKKEDVQGPPGARFNLWAPLSVRKPFPVNAARVCRS